MPEDGYVAPASSVAFVGAMAYRFPILLPVLSEHLRDQEATVLPHVFMAELERWIEIEFVNRYDGSREVITGLLAFIEEAMVDGDDDVQNVIHVSFLEHLPRSGSLGDGIRSLVGPRSMEALREIG